MRQVLCMTLCVLLLSVFTAGATVRVGKRAEGVCTRDFNPWGNASQCSCIDGQVYDERSGLCLLGDEPETIIVQGAVSTGMMAIGGETTGVIIKTPEDLSYELILKIADQEQISKLSGMWFEIEGELITIEGVEMNRRKAIIVDRVGVLE